MDKAKGHSTVQCTSMHPCKHGAQGQGTGQKDRACHKSKEHSTETDQGRGGHGAGLSSRAHGRIRGRTQGQGKQNNTCRHRVKPKLIHITRIVCNESYQFPVMLLQQCKHDKQPKSHVPDPCLTDEVRM